MLLLAYGSATNSMTSEEKANALVQAIAQAAEEKWGEDYLPDLVRAYCEIEQRETGNKAATPINRRTQIIAALTEANPRTATLFRLVAAVGAELQLVLTRAEIKSFS